MKTSTKIFSIIAAAAIAFVTISSVSADTLDTDGFGNGFGPGNGGQDGGLLEDYMEAAVAEALGVSVEELQEMTSDGSNHLDAALSLGFSVEEFRAIMADAREDALAAAAEDGIVIPQFGLNAEGEGPFGNTNRMRPGGGKFGSGFEGFGGFGGRNEENCALDECPLQPEGGMMRRGGRR